jgi:asparagine synthase (glutamine-hydrolysing)
MAVPPGHAVSLAQGRTVTRAFWSLARDREIRYADERDYEEQMLDLFREAVQVRIASGTPSSAELSGGLDSSSIVCMADRLRHELPAQIPQFTTFSYTHENCPDEKYFREVERVCGLSASHLELQDCPVVTADMAAATPTWWEPRFRELARRMAAMGSGVLMTGQLGDLIMGNLPDDSGQVSEWLAERRSAKLMIGAGRCRSRFTPSCGEASGRPGSPGCHP